MPKNPEGIVRDLVHRRPWRDAVRSFSPSPSPAPSSPTPDQSRVSRRQASRWPQTLRFDDVRAEPSRAGGRGSRATHAPSPERPHHVVRHAMGRDALGIDIAAPVMAPEGAAAADTVLRAGPASGKAAATPSTSSTSVRDRGSPSSTRSTRRARSVRTGDVSLHRHRRGCRGRSATEPDWTLRCTWPRSGAPRNAHAARSSCPCSRPPRSAHRPPHGPRCARSSR